MTPPEVAEFVFASLVKIGEAAPGFLEVFSGQKDDEAALESARLALDGVPLSPARTGIDRRRAELAAQGTEIELVQAVFFGILRAAEARAAFAEIPVEDGVAVVPVAEAKAQLATLIEKIEETREEARPTDSDKHRAK